MPPDIARSRFLKVLLHQLLTFEQMTSHPAAHQERGDDGFQRRLDLVLGPALGLRRILKRLHPSPSVLNCASGVRTWQFEIELTTVKA